MTAYRMYFDVEVSYASMQSTTFSVGSRDGSCMPIPEWRYVSQKIWNEKVLACSTYCLSLYWFSDATEWCVLWFSLEEVCLASLSLAVRAKKDGTRPYFPRSDKWCDGEARESSGSLHKQLM